MKKLIFFIVFMVLLSQAVFAPLTSLFRATHTPTLVCTVQNSPCPQGSVDVLHISSTNPSRAELPTFNNYPNHLCCGGVPGLSRACSEPFDTLLKLNQAIDALASDPILTSYRINICLSAPTGISCTVDRTAPNPDYACVVGMSGYDNAQLSDCVTSTPLKVFCKILPEQHIPKYWHEAFGQQYPHLLQGHVSVNETYHSNGTNVVVIQSNDFGEYGIVSDSYVVQPSSVFTASVNATCSNGIAQLELLFWNNQQINWLSGYRASTSGTERLVVSDIVPTWAERVTLLLSASNNGAPTVDCAFDDVQLVFNETNKPAPTAFNPYASYDEDMLSNPLLPYQNPVLGGYACCPSDQCWDGTQCTANVANDPTAQPISNYRCIDGNWVSTPEKTDLQGNPGFCPVDTQCLVDVNGKAAFNNNVTKFFVASRPEDRPQCVSDGQFVLDNYCDAGVWTSRTRLLAQRLLDLVKARGDPNQYTLYCDDYEHALVSTGDPVLIETIEGKPQRGIDPLTGAEKLDASSRSCFDIFAGTTDIPATCTNHFCVLKYNEGSNNKTVVATSLNVPPAQLLSLFNYSQTACAGKGANGFELCPSTGTTTLWFDDRNGNIIYSRDGVNLQHVSVLQSFFSAVKGLISSILAFFTGTQSLPNTDVTFVEHTTQFDRLYLNAAGTKRIIAIQETRDGKTFILAQYLGFTENLCDYVQRISTTGLGTGEAVTCSQVGGFVTIYTDDPAVVELWQEFTSRLRVKP